MAIRLQPLEIDIPADDPFKNDLLSRKDSAEVLTHIVGSESPPSVFETLRGPFTDSDWCSHRCAPTRDGSSGRRPSL